jgi:hypothetical protein
MCRNCVRLSSYAVLLITLTLGLWPFHSPRDNVSLLPGVRGPHFGKFATALSEGPLPDLIDESDPAASIEIWLRPPPCGVAVPHILAFYSDGIPYRFSLH